MNLARTTVQQCAFNAGQAAALGIDLNVLLQAHPQRDLLVATIRAGIDELVAKNVPEDFIQGIEAARARYFPKENDLLTA